MKDRLKELRKTLGLKQRDIAEKLGVSTSAVGNWECGKDSPGDARVYQLCKEYNVNRTWLETGEGEMFLPPPEKPSLEEIQRQFVEALIERFTDEQRQVIYDAMMKEAEKDRKRAEKK